MNKFKGFGFALFFLTLVLSVGCAGAPVREAVKVDLSAPLGKIEGNQFTGIRYPFKVSAPPNWKIATEYPKFMLDLGYEKDGLEESQVFIFSPETQSNLQIDFTPAGRHSTFDQSTIEWLTTAAEGSFTEEFHKDYGGKVPLKISPTKPFALRGVPFAAEKHASYTVKGQKREQGWVYAFAEPYQIFILYVIVEKEGVDDRQGLKAILDSFEYLAQGSK